MTFNVPYSIIGTGSTGNAVVLNTNILIDCGVPFRAIKPHLSGIKIVLLTHMHGDHFNRSTVAKIAEERPTVRFAGGSWMVPALVDAGVSKRNIDPLDSCHLYTYEELVTVETVPLHHDVPNIGYKLYFPDGRKAFYATDTNHLNGIKAKGFDLYMVEANYDDEEIQRRIKCKELNGEYAYELRVLQNHLSKSKCDAWIFENAVGTSEYIYMHQHRERTGD